MSAPINTRRAWVGLMKRDEPRRLAELPEQVHVVTEHKPQGKFRLNLEGAILSVQFLAR